MTVTSVENYHRYDIRLHNKAIESIYRNGHEIKSFVRPDNRSDLQKLYVVKSNSEIIYIGQTNRNVRDRLRYGLKAEGKGGYYGYMWSNLPKVCILIWCFDGKTKEYVETVEGEVVFLVRMRTGKWPSYQMEIHFHNAKTDEVEVAKAILREATK